MILPLLGITWALGLFAVNESTLLFSYLFTIFNSLQVPHDVTVLVCSKEFEFELQNISPSCNNEYSNHVFYFRVVSFSFSMCCEMKGLVVTTMS